jgi:hypothetical protein
MKKQEYTVVMNTSVLTLELLVESRLNSGWTLAGGVTRDNEMYMQAAYRTIGGMLLTKKRITDED